MKSLLKKSVLVFSIVCIPLAYIFSEPNKFGFCKSVYVWGTDQGCFDQFPDLMVSFFVILFLTIIPFSLITFWMKEEIFKKWFRFAAWYVPILVVINLTFTPGGGGVGVSGGAINEGFYFLFLGTFYLIFAIISTVKIVRTYKASKIS